MIRAGYEIEDIQNCLVALLKANTSAPWTSWDVIHAWPADDAFSQMTKPIIYVDRPEYADDIVHSGGARGTRWECIVGLWDDNKSGGAQEIGIMQSQLLYFFRQRKALNQKTFTITIGSTTSTSKTLLYHGISVQGIGPARTIDNDASNHNYRVEYNLTIIT